MRLFDRRWADLTDEERKAHHARMAKVRAELQASIDADRRPEIEPLGPAYLRDGKRPIPWRGRIIEE